MQILILMGGIYEVHRRDGLSCYDIRTKFTKIGSGIRRLIEGIHRYTDSKVMS
jgi:hypothetical protein